MSSCSSSGWRGGSKFLYSLSSKSLSGEAEFIRGSTIAGGDDVEGVGLPSSSSSSEESFVCYFLPQVMSTVGTL